MFFFFFPSEEISEGLFFVFLIQQMSRYRVADPSFRVLGGVFHCVCMRKRHLRTPREAEEKKRGMEREEEERRRGGRVAEETPSLIPVTSHPPIATSQPVNTAALRRRLLTCSSHHPPTCVQGPPTPPASQILTHRNRNRREWC